MSRKLYSISQLINENIRLKKKIEKSEVDNLKASIEIINFCRNGRDEELDKIKAGFEQALADIIN